jgi:hypothetical protein
LVTETDTYKSLVINTESLVREHTEVGMNWREQVSAVSDTFGEATENVHIGMG